MTRHFVSFLFLSLWMICQPLAASAERITSREGFVDAVEGRQLSRLGITLVVSPTGQIGGRAFGRKVSGSWEWQAGWFCRTLAWGNQSWPYNCQLVQIDGNRITFTADKGRGDRAQLTIN